ncbi:MAG: AEC family transporter [Synergistaceae bacterium]|nr:AEC family transporter [Synergistaceae bacterium]
MKLDLFMVMSNLISLFALIAVGYIAIRSGILTQKASVHFTTLLMKITLPCTIFISLVSREYDPAFVHDSMIMMIAGLIVFSGMLYLSRYIAILIKVDKSYRGVWAFSCAFSNSGFMGFPICLALFGPEGLALSVVLNIAFNMTVYTIGAIEISHDNPENDAEKLSMKAIIFSTVNISTLVSLIFYFGRIPVPDFIASPVSYLSGITTPISMIIIGMALARERGLELFTNRDAWISTLFRLIIYPVALCLLLRFIPFGGNPLIWAVLVIVVAMPGASVTAVLCQIYNGNIDFSAKAMFLQNLMCVLTIPLVCMIL